MEGRQGSDLVMVAIWSSRPSRILPLLMLCGAQQCCRAGQSAIAQGCDHACCQRRVGGLHACSWRATRPARSSCCTKEGRLAACPSRHGQRVWSQCRMPASASPGGSSSECTLWSSVTRLSAVKRESSQKGQGRGSGHCPCTHAVRGTQRDLVPQAGALHPHAVPWSGHTLRPGLHQKPNACEGTARREAGKTR